MPKIVFIGAGSLGFARGLVRDLLTFPRLRESTLTLADIDPERLDFAARAVRRIVELGGYPAKVEATMNRAEALEGADYVLCTILGAGSRSGATTSRSPRRSTRRNSFATRCSSIWTTTSRNPAGTTRSITPGSASGPI
ncbi:MAG: hypothetical protein ACM3RP_06250 [Chitinophagales bacterium]